MPAPSSSSRSTPSPDRHITLRLPRHSLAIAGIAFVAGLLLFLGVWLANRNSGFHTASTQPAPQQVAQVEPLPEPLAAAAGSSDMPDARPAPPAEEQATLVETAPPAPPAAADTAAAPAQDPSGALPPPGPQPRPLPGQTPAPQYPASALRAGEQGTVVVRVDVDATGWPSGVTVVQRSGSRALDRAAAQAVRDWRFQPAVQDGTPVPGSLEIPFDFKPAD